VGSQIFLQVFESLLDLLSPLKLVLFLEELKKGRTLTPSREINLLMEALGRLHFGDSRHLLEVRVNTTMGDHIPE
jgi:hypothetical protein